MKGALLATIHATIARFGAPQLKGFKLYESEGRRGE